MKSTEVVIASYLEPELVERVAAAHPEVNVTYQPELLPSPRYPADHTGSLPRLDPDELDRWSRVLARAEVCFDFDWFAPEALPERSPKLRFIQATSAGIGGFMERTGLNESDIEVATAAGVHAVPLAEFALMGALYFTKGVDQLNRWKAQRHWERYATHRLAGRRALVIGLGGIGRQVAASFSAVGVEVWGMARNSPAKPIPGLERAITREQLSDALTQTDILVIACPLTDITRGLIGRAEIAALPAGAVVVNIGRGPVIDEQALTAALQEDRLSGACLDVFETEPLPSDSPLWGMDNVIVSPHSASTLADENLALTELFIENLGRYLSGEPLVNRYDRAAGY